MDPRCALCRSDGGEAIWRGAACRIVLVDESGYPGYCRVIWNAHVREIADLSSGERATLWRVVGLVEEAVRAALEPDKINVAALGNVVPHLHVHVVPRFEGDAHFPDPVWGSPRRTPARHAADADRIARVRRALRELVSASRSIGSGT